LVGGRLRRGGRACQEPSGQIPPHPGRGGRTRLPLRERRWVTRGPGANLLTHEARSHDDGIGVGRDLAIGHELGAASSDFSGTTSLATDIAVLITSAAVPVAATAIASCLQLVPGSASEAVVDDDG
jgi:hypothetical protein